MTCNMDDLLRSYPDLHQISSHIEDAYLNLKACYINGGKVLVCGNGGSAADSEHIVGELMKGFLKKRPVPSSLTEQMVSAWGDEGQDITKGLNGALPAIALTVHNALGTAFANDADPSLVFAQQVYGYGKPGDILIAISTSGSSGNVVKAAKLAKVMGMKVIGLTGMKKGTLDVICDVVIKVPRTETYQVQELHLPVYHCLCAMLEDDFFEV